MMGLRQVTVFGASGFIGRYVVRRLAGEGVRIVAAERDPEGAAFLKPMGDVGQVVPLACDVRDASRVARAIEGSDGVVNLVGILYEHGRQRFEALHATAPGTIADAARAAGIDRFVHISALGAAPGAIARYQRTKAEGEAAVRAALPGAVVLRPSIVFGPEDDFFNRFAAVARLSPVVPLFGGGRNRFQPVYVGDVAEAVFAGLARRDTAGRTFELGGPHVYTFRELMELILAEIRRRRLLLPLPMVMADLMGLFGDMAAALGLPPVITSDQARMLRTDNVVSAGAAGLSDLGIEPRTLEVVLPAYLDRFRPAGRFSRTSL